MENFYGLNPAQYTIFRRWHKIAALVLLSLLMLLWLFGYGPTAFRKCAGFLAGKVEKPAAIVVAPVSPVVPAAPAPSALPPAAPEPPPAVTEKSPGELAPAQTARIATAVISEKADATAKSNPPSAMATDVLPAARIFFEINKHHLPKDAENRLEKIVLYLVENPKARVMLSGFHDRSGSRKHNVELAKERADSVRIALQKAGIQTERIIFQKPAQTTGGANPREARRVEIKIAE